MSKPKQSALFREPMPNDREGIDDNAWDEVSGLQDHEIPLRDEEDDWGKLRSSDENNNSQEADPKTMKTDPKALPFARPPAVVPNDKQFPSGNKKLSDNQKQKPDFSSLKNSKLPPPKDNDPMNHINLNGNSKPHLGIGSKKPVPESTFSHYDQDLRASGLGLSSFSKKPQQQINPFSSIPDMLDNRPKYEKLLEKAEEYIRDKSLRSLEGLFDFNAEGTSLLREINELLTKAVDKHKAKLIAEVPTYKPTSAKLSKTRDGSGTDRFKSQFQKELEAGEKLMNNLTHELRELTTQEQKIKNPS